MSINWRPRALLTLAITAILALGVTACGDDEGDASGDGSEAEAALIESNPDNAAVELTIGSKDFTEQYILGEIYAQALEAAGYTVEKDLNLGSEQIAFKALKEGEVSAYPEYASTALSSIYGLPSEEVPTDAQEAFDLVQPELEQDGLVAFEPTPFADANSLGVLTEKAKELGVTTISDLKGKTEDLTLAGSPECRQRTDCLLGLQDVYGLEFGKFTPVELDLRYEVLDNGDADLSILFTSDAALFANPDAYTLLEDDQEIFPAGNVLFIASEEVAAEAGPDFQATVETVQEQLSFEVIQELNARVDLDKEEPEAVAADYLTASGYIE